MLEAYRRDGSLPARQAFARSIGNHRVDPHLLQQAQTRLRGLRAPADGPLLPTPPSDWVGLPTKGTVKLFVLLVDFNDYPHSEPANATTTVQARIFGEGDAAAAAPTRAWPI